MEKELEDQTVTSAPIRPRVDNPTAYLQSLPVKTRLEKSIQLLERYEEATNVARRFRNASASQLSDIGFSYAEIGEIIGVSGTRIKALIKEHKACNAKKNNTSKSEEEK